MENLIKMLKSFKCCSISAISLSLLIFSTSVVWSREYPIGEPVEKNGMEIAAVYINPPVEMDFMWGGLSGNEADVHLEADIHAIRGSKNGFGAGEWIPYLAVTYILKNLDTGQEETGLLWQMVASDGPHYGRNIKLNPGNYKLIFIIDNPSKGTLARHTDKETGVAEWWDTFSVEYTFKFEGSKKK